MEKKTFASMLLAAAFTLTACTNDDIPAQDNRVALQVTSGIQSRAYDNQWEAGDRIGIYAFTEGTTTVADGYANIPYITQTSGADGTFAPDGTCPPTAMPATSWPTILTSSSAAMSTRWT